MKLLPQCPADGLLFLTLSSRFVAAKQVCGFMKKALLACGTASLLVIAAVLLVLGVGAVAFGQSSQGWRPAPVQGRITVDRRIDSTTSFSGVELRKRERASLTITVDSTVRVERSGAKGLSTEGTVVTTVKGREIWNIADSARFTHSYNLSGREPFGSDPGLTKQRVYLEVNEAKGLYRLKVPSGRAKGPCVSAVTSGDQERRKTSEIDMEVSAWFPDGPGEMEGTYDPGTGIIQGQYAVTGYQFPGGPVVSGEDRARVWASDDPNLPEVRQEVGPEKLLPVEFRVAWSLSIDDQGPAPGPRIRTRALQMTGLGPEDRGIRTAILRMTGLRPGDRVIRTDILQMTGLRLEERIIRTETLQMTGLSLEERGIRTEMLQMTGLSLEDRIIRTEALQMTGLSPDDRRIRTEALEMTGLGQ